jgi:hypothetical protein
MIFFGHLHGKQAELAIEARSVTHIALFDAS